MEEIIDKITEWPVIIQGLFGSAIFWVVVEGGQRAYRQLAAKLSYDHKLAQVFSLHAYVEDDLRLKTSFRLSSFYGAAHYSLKAAVVLVMTVAASSFWPIFTLIGTLVALYFLFRALAFVPHLDSFGSHDDAEKRLDAILEEIREAAMKRDPGAADFYAARDAWKQRKANASKSPPLRPQK